MAGRLSDGFSRCLGEGARARLAGLTVLEGVLDALLERGRARWPDLGLEVETFLACLARSVEDEPDPGRALETLNASDLYLACACAGGNARALAHFERSFLSEIDALVSSMRAPRVIAGEARQLLSQKLFVAADGVRPRICDYAGKGNLRTWFRVVAARTIVSLLRKQGRELPARDEACLELRAAGDDPEMALLKARYRADFKLAFQQAMRSLTVRQRNLLKHQLVDELTVDQIAGIYRVHRVTAARWLAGARREVWLGVRRVLCERLRVDTAELEQLLGQVRSQLDLSIARVLELRSDGCAAE